MERLVVLLLFCSFLQAMEPAQSICSLAHLPEDLCNIIAGYLVFKDRETDVEFIERAKATGIAKALSKEIMSKADLVAFSYNKQLCAQFWNELRVTPDMGGFLPQDFLKVKNVTTNEERDFMIPQKVRTEFSHNGKMASAYFPLMVIACEFNKQGTRVMVLGGNRIGMGEDSGYNFVNHVIYELADEQEHHAKSRKTLDEYFRQHRVCKKVTGSLPLRKMEPPVCHLARLPIAVQDLISEYLTFKDIETDANFIWRTEIKSYNVSDYHREAQHYERPNGCFAAYSPDSLKKVFLDQSDTSRSRVVGSDRVPRNSTRVSLDAVAELIDADKEYYQTVDVAISSDGQWFGRLAQRKVEFPKGFAGQFLSLTGIEGNRAQITVIHIPTNTKRDFDIPILLKSVVFLDFNKQGTKIITHGVCYEKEEPISFMYNLVAEKEHTAKSRKTLSGYFRERGVCKSLAHSLSQKGK